MFIAHWCAAPSYAQSPVPAPHVELPMQSIQGSPAASEVQQSEGALEEANAKSAAAMDAFDRRIAGRAHRAVSSICDRCLSTSQDLRPRLPQMKAGAPPKERIVDDPAQAPAH
jgi:hypothetical protein